MIEITGLTKRFGRLEVLRGVDLTVHPGRITAIVGPNAAGKTTLIKLILGLARPDAGRITVGGEPVGDDPAYRARIGYMPQIARFPGNLTAAELMDMLTDLRRGVATSAGAIDGTDERGKSGALGGAKSGASEGASGELNDGAADDELIDALRLGAHLHKPLRLLSGGTRQKVNAVLALRFRPELIILDEPTAGLDPVSSSVFKDRLLAERAAGRTIILTSHILSEVDELADDIAFLLDGRVKFAGPVHDLKIETRQLSLERAVAEMMVRGAA